MKLTTQDCQFDKVNKRLVYNQPHQTFPQFVILKSSHTGREVLFVEDTEMALKHEFWDGQECWYIPNGDLQKVEHLVITCGY